MSDTSLPDELRETMARAVRLEYWNIFWTLTIIVTMGLVLGQSQTMKTAWIEDTLGLVPPVMFLIAALLAYLVGMNTLFIGTSQNAFSSGT